MAWTLAFAVTTVLFVLVTGAHDDAAIIGLGLRFPRAPIWTTVALPALALMGVPYLLGVAVTTTFTERLAGLGAGFGAGLPVSLPGLAVVLAIGACAPLAGVLLGYGLPRCRARCPRTGRCPG
ncbi:hypothetical protein ACIBG7_38870 [Nonomuraea sp. NPDC050328]|uniref:hypothetical protein n=1 Tax=Nonomuraea sp. NPDC050328 TaxID=3364361 RepID=UPI0037BDA059